MTLELCYQSLLLRPEIPECMSLPYLCLKWPLSLTALKKTQIDSNSLTSLGQKQAFHRAGPSGYKLWIKAKTFLWNVLLQFVNVGIQRKTWVFKRKAQWMSLMYVCTDKKIQLKTQLLPNLHRLCAVSQTVTVVLNWQEPSALSIMSYHDSSSWFPIHSF